MQVDDSDIFLCQWSLIWVIYLLSTVLQICIFFNFMQVLLWYVTWALAQFVSSGSKVQILWIQNKLMKNRKTASSIRGFIDLHICKWLFGSLVSRNTTTFLSFDLLLSLSHWCVISRLVGCIWVRCHSGFSWFRCTLLQVVLARFGVSNCVWKFLLLFMRLDKKRREKMTFWLLWPEKAMSFPWAYYEYRSGPSGIWSFKWCLEDLYAIS